MVCALELAVFFLSVFTFLIFTFTNTSSSERMLMVALLLGSDVKPARSFGRAGVFCISLNE